MTTTRPEERPGEGAADSQPVPLIALRTYRSLRLASVAVIAMLAVAIIREVVLSPSHCLQGSVSAYYYTPAQSVFTGTLLGLGLVMVALWGRTPGEDAWFNLAGMLAPVVAFVPTDDVNRCRVLDAAGNPVKPDQVSVADIIAANTPASLNNMTAYLIVVITVLAVLGAVGGVALWKQSPWMTKQPVSFWVPWALAVSLCALGSVLFWGSGRDWFLAHAHAWSANVMFIFIGFVVFIIAFGKGPGRRFYAWVEGFLRRHHGTWLADPQRKWRANRWEHADPRLVEAPSSDRSVVWWRRKPGAGPYFAIALGMVIGFVLFRGIAGRMSWFDPEHPTFWLEAWEISMLALFWVLQTRDRWNEGAPLIKAEVASQATSSTS